MEGNRLSLWLPVDERDRKYEWRGVQAECSTIFSPRRLRNRLPQPLQAAPRGKSHRVAFTRPTFVSFSNFALKSPRANKRHLESFKRTEDTFPFRLLKHFHVPLRLFCCSVQECGRAAAEQQLPRVASAGTDRETQLPPAVRKWNQTCNANQASSPTIIVPNSFLIRVKRSLLPHGSIHLHHKPLFVILTGHSSCSKLPAWA